MNGATLVIIIILSALALSFTLTVGAFYYAAKKRAFLPQHKLHPNSPAARHLSVESIQKHSHRKWYMMRDPKIVETPVYEMSGALGTKRVNTYDEELATGTEDFLMTNKPAPVAKF